MAECLIVDSDDERSVIQLDFSDRLFFEVPFAKKTKAKEIGAKWCGEVKKWYIMKTDKQAWNLMNRAGFRLYVFHIFGNEEPDFLFHHLNEVRLKYSWDLCENRDCRLCQMKHEKHPSWCSCDWCSNFE